MPKNAKYGPIFWLVSTIIVLLTLASIFPPDFEVFMRGSEFAVPFMLVLLFLGMFFLSIKQRNLMFVSLACCTILCLFLKNASNENLIFPQLNNLANISVMHLNLSSIEGSPTELLKIVNEFDPDIISLHEVKPDWDFFLKKNLGSDYLTNHSVVRIDPYGKALYSKIPFFKVDTFMFQDVPSLKSEIEIGDVHIQIMSSYLDPPLNNLSRAKNSDHIQYIINRAMESHGPLLALGDFNLVYWSGELRNFTEKTGLLNSRRNVVISNNRPYDHIFYSPQLECINFKEIEDKDFNHIGIFGQYQIISNKQLTLENE